MLPLVGIGSDGHRTCTIVIRHLDRKGDSAPRASIGGIRHKKEIICHVRRNSLQFDHVIKTQKNVAHMSTEKLHAPTML